MCDIDHDNANGNDHDNDSDDDNAYDNNILILITRSVPVLKLASYEIPMRTSQRTCNEQA